MKCQGPRSHLMRPLLLIGMYLTPYFKNKIHREIESWKECKARDGITEIRQILAGCPATLADPEEKWLHCRKYYKALHIKIYYGLSRGSLIAP